MAAAHERRGSMPSRVRLIAAMLALLVTSSGCLFEATVNALGGANIKVHYRVDPSLKPEKSGDGLQSSDVKLLTKGIDKDHYVDATLETANLTKLYTAPLFKAIAIAFTDGAEKGTQTLTIKNVKRPVAKLPPNFFQYYGNQSKLVLHLPGDVVKSNATETNGNTASWTIETAKFMDASETTFEVTYKVPPPP
jgi:hypothetical protein